MMSYVLPKAFENGADMVADCKFVIELAGGSSVLNIWEENRRPQY